MPALLAMETRTPEKLWSVSLGGHRLACELHPVGDLGWEVHLYRDGWMLASRRFVIHAEALEFSAGLRADYQSGPELRCRSFVLPSHFWWSGTPH